MLITLSQVEVVLAKLDRLIQGIKDIAEGRYSSALMVELTGPDTAEDVRIIAEAMLFMIERIEAREKHMEMLNQQVKEVNRQIRRNTVATVSTMAKALAARDAYTEGHAERVSRISGLLAAEMGLGDEETELIQLAGLLHDIGKIGFPDYLFLPHGKNTPEEIVREIKRHPATGAEILMGLDFLGPAILYIRYHHERPDGLGYPYGLKGGDIPLGARIIAVADAFDAITTDRPYQKSSSFDEALVILQKGAGTKWDSACVAAFQRILPKIPPQTDTVKASKEGLLCLADNRHEILLEPGPVGGARMRWLKPGVDFKRYGRLMLEPVTFFFADDSEYKGMDPQELKELADLFNRQLRESLKKQFSIVNAPGPDVARIRFAITDLRQNRPNLSDAEQGGLGLADLKIGMIKSFVGSGATCAELLVLDSMTNSPIAAAKDDQKYGLKERFTQWGSAEDAFKYWADRLGLFLDQARQ